MREERKRKGWLNRLLQNRVSWNVGQSRKQDWIGFGVVRENRAGQARPDDEQA